MGGKTQTSTSQLTIPNQVMRRYDYANRMARDAANNPFQQFGTEASDFVAQINPQQMAGIDTINNASNVGQQYFGAANDYITRGARDDIRPGDLEIDRYMSPYLRQVVDSTSELMNQQQEQQQSGQTGQAIMSGAFGGDRAGIGAANLAQQQMLARQNILSGLLNQGYNTALSTAQQQQGVALSAEQANADRMLMAGQGMAGLGGTLQGLALQQGQAQMAAGTQQQQTDQAGISALYNQFMQQQAYPFQTAQFLANIAMGTGALSGSTTTTTQPAPFFSDRRLKTDVKHIGYSDHGMPIYSYRYKGDDKTHIGFMADEVEKKHPEAVGVAGGYKTVDYSKADKFAEGGVVGPYSSELGSTPGASSYVPQPYLEVRGLVTPDPALMDTSNQSLLAYMEQAANAGENIASLRDSFGELKKTTSGWFGNDTPSSNYRGGLVRATGGGVFQPQAPEVPTATTNPINDVLEKQEQDNSKIASLKEAQQPAPPKSGAETAGALAGGVGSLLSGIAGIFALSDRRTKENVKRIGKTFKGTPIYQFNYKGDRRPVMGFMADEIEDKNPDAVMKGRDGLKRVDYSKASQFYRGGVVGYADGGSPMLDEQELIDQGLAAGLRLAGINAMAENKPAIPAANQNEIERQGLATGLHMASRPAAVPVAENTGVVPAPPITETREVAAAPAVKAYAEPAPGVVPAKTSPSAYSAAAAEAYIRKAAEARGIDPDIAVKVARSEGLGDGIWQSNVMKGDMREPSFGPFQMLVGDGKDFPKGMGNDFMEKTGLDPRDQSSWQTQVDYALDYAAKNGWSPWNGAKAIGLGARDGISEAAKAVGQYANEAVDGVRATLGDAGKTLASIPSAVGDKLEGLGTGAKGLFNKVTSNEDLMLSILSGLGAMASSPSRYLGAAMLQGLGAGANTYAGLRSQRQELIAKRAENLKTVAKEVMRLNALGNPVTMADYAKKLGYDGPIPEDLRPENILGDHTNGQGVDYGAYDKFSTSTRFGENVKVKNMNDPVFLRDFIRKYEGVTDDPIIADKVATARNRLTEIETTGQTIGVNADGTPVAVTVREVRDNINAKAKTESDILATQDFRKAAPEVMAATSQGLAIVEQQKKLFQSLEAGALNTDKAQLAAVLKSVFGINTTPEILADPAQVQQAIKMAKDQTLTELRNMPGGAPAAELEALEGVTAGPDLQPEAVKKIIAVKEAALRRAKDRYELRNKTNFGNDQYAYELWFEKEHPFSKYLKESMDGMPAFAGEKLDATKAEEELIRRGYKKDASGQWVKG